MIFFLLFSSLIGVNPVSASSMLFGVAIGGDRIFFLFFFFFFCDFWMWFVSYLLFVLAPNHQLGRSIWVWWSLLLFIPSCIMRQLSKVSYAFEKSRMMLTWVPWSLHCMWSRIVMTSWVAHEWAARKPWCRVVSIMHCSRCSSMCQRIMCSRVLQHMKVSNAGL